jgi:hypothetical protein
MRQRLLKPARERYRDRGGDHGAPRKLCPPAPPERCSDPAVERVRDAGGPLDRASYVCGCGYVFNAAVSTTVACPHCGADQAW